MRSPGEVQVQPNCALESQHHRRTTKDSSRSGASLRLEDKLCVQERVEPPGGGGAPEMVSESYALLIYTSGLVLVQL